MKTSVSQIPLTVSCRLASLKTTKFGTLYLILVYAKENTSFYINLHSVVMTKAFQHLNCIVSALFLESVGIVSHHKVHKRQKMAVPFETSLALFMEVRLIQSPSFLHVNQNNTVHSKEKRMYRLVLRLTRLNLDTKSRRVGIKTSQL